MTESYQWLRSGTPITGATGATYQVTAADLGNQLSLRVTGAADGFEPRVTTSNTITAVPAEAPSAATPTKIAGSGKVGTVLTSALPTWNPSTGVESSRQWLRNGTPVFEATDPTFTVRPGDLGATITLQVTGARTGHADGSSTSNGIVGATGDAPAATTAPAVAGSGKVGRLARGDATGLERLRCHQRGPVAARRATHRRRHRHRVRRRRSGRRPVPCRPLHRHLHRARHGRRGEQPGNRQPGRRTHRRVRSGRSGSGKVGTTLNVPTVSWNLSGVTETLQWFRGSTPIAGGTSRNHVVSAADLGNGLSVRVTGAVAVAAAAGRRPARPSSPRLATPRSRHVPRPSPAALWSAAS